MSKGAQQNKIGANSNLFFTRWAEKIIAVPPRKNIIVKIAKHIISNNSSLFKFFD